MKTLETTIHQKTIAQGLNLRGTQHSGKSAEQLRMTDPKLAMRWARFIKANKAQLVREISGIVCAS
jgi:hypothetical protein